MDDLDTEITGTPASVEVVADWLRTRLALAVETAADAFNDARKDATSAWVSPAGYEFVDSMSTARRRSDDLEGAVRALADDLDDFAHKQRSCQSEMAAARAKAAAAGLTVSGFWILSPGPSWAYPDYPAGDPTDETMDAYHDSVRRWNEHYAQVNAFREASTEANRVDRRYATACQELQEDYTLTDHAAWALSLTDAVGDGIIAAAATSLGRQKSALLAEADRIRAETRRAIQNILDHPELYQTKRWKWWPFDKKYVFFGPANQTLDLAAVSRDVLKAESGFRVADDIAKAAEALEVGKTAKFFARAGKVLGPVGLGLGLYSDWQEGETAPQIVTSQGVSAALGVAAGVGASAAAGALMGAAFGSVVPVAGTAVGAVVGTVIGAGVAIFSDGAIDSLFENGPDVGKAFSEGLDSLQDTGEAIGGFFSGVGSTVGGWFD